MDWEIVLSIAFVILFVVILIVNSRIAAFEIKMNDLWHQNDIRLIENGNVCEKRLESLECETKDHYKKIVDYKYDIADLKDSVEEHRKDIQELINKREEKKK